jgi:hypothetical protein
MCLTVMGVALGSRAAEACHPWHERSQSAGSATHTIVVVDNKYDRHYLSFRYAAKLVSRECQSGSGGFIDTRKCNLDFVAGIYRELVNESPANEVSPVSQTRRRVYYPGMAANELAQLYSAAQWLFTKSDFDVPKGTSSAVAARMLATRGLHRIVDSMNRVFGIGGRNCGDLRDRIVNGEALALDALGSGLKYQVFNARVLAVELVTGASRWRFKSGNERRTALYAYVMSDALSVPASISAEVAEVYKEVFGYGPPRWQVLRAAQLGREGNWRARLFDLLVGEAVRTRFDGAVNRLGRADLDYVATNQDYKAECVQPLSWLVVDRHALKDACGPGEAAFHPDRGRFESARRHLAGLASKVSDKSSAGRTLGTLIRTLDSRRAATVASEEKVGSPAYRTCVATIVDAKAAPPCAWWDGDCFEKAVVTARGAARKMLGAAAKSTKTWTEFERVSAQLKPELVWTWTEDGRSVRDYPCRIRARGRAKRRAHQISVRSPFQDFAESCGARWDRFWDAEAKHYEACINETGCHESCRLGFLSGPKRLLFSPNISEELGLDLGQ